MNNFNNRYGVAPSPIYSTDVQKVNAEENIKLISTRYGADFYNALGGLYTALTGKTLNTNKILNIVDILNKIKQDLTKKYLYSLLFPEKCKGSRIPTKFPVPSATFQMNDFILVSPNASGNFVVQWSPQNLSSSTANNELVLNTAAGLTGLNNDATYVTQTALTNALVTQWQAFRVVSACIVVQYIGSYINLQGTFGAGLDISGSNSNSFDSNYSNFSNIDDRLWSQVTRVDEGLKIVYFPKDYNDLSFIRPNQTPSQNNLASAIRLLVYGQSLPASTQCIRIDFIKNVEAIPGPAFGDIVETGYLESDSMTDHALESSKLLTKSNLVVSRIEEQENLEKIMKTSGNDYLQILNDPNLQERKRSRADILKNSLDKVREDNSYMTRDILYNPNMMQRYMD